MRNHDANVYCAAGTQAPARLLKSGWLTVVLALLGWLALARPAPVSAQGESIRWAWSGAVTADRATVVARLAPGLPEARLVVTPDRADADSMTYPSNGFAKVSPHGVVRFSAGGLAPSTRYRYRVETPGGAGIEGRFRTWANGPFSFRVAFASCATTGSSHRVFDAIRSMTPDLFVHMGDFHYLNIGRNDADAFRRAYDRVLASPRQSALYRSAPLAYMFDDHDFGSDNSDGTSASRPAATSVYREVVPHYPVPEGTSSIYQSFTIGRVRVIVTDTRTARAPVDAPRPRTMLGEAQLRWFEAELQDARDAPLVVWVNTVPWITKGNEATSEGWGPYSEERTRIADRIEALGLTARIVMLSGDGHMAALDDGSNSAYMSNASDRARGFVVVHGAPMDRWTRVKGGPYSHGVSRRNHQFGLLDVADTGSALDVTVSARDAVGGVIPGLILKLRCERDACRVVPGK